VVRSSASFRPSFYKIGQTLCRRISGLTLIFIGTELLMYIKRRTIAQLRTLSGKVMWIRIQEQGNLPKLKNKPGFLAFKKLRRYVF
jgi:hypothetical protein